MASGSTRSKQKLGQFVQPICKRSGLRTEEIAERATCSPSTVNRLVSGRNLPSRAHFGAVLAVVQATDAEREQAWRLYDVAKLGTARIEHAEDLPAAYRRFRMDESEAVRERTFDTVLVPGLLQTAEYATALSVASSRLIRSEHWEQRAAAERQERQALLEQEEFTFSALVSEAALRNLIGGPDVMAPQLDHLLVMNERANVSILTVPFTSGMSTVGSLILLDFDDGGDRTAYVDSMIGIQGIQDPDEVASLVGVWEDYATGACTPAQSVEIIRAERTRVR